MTQIVLGLDQGTSSTRCIAFDRELAALGSGAVQSQATRAAVRAEAVQAQRLGQIPAGEASSM